MSKIFFAGHIPVHVLVQIEASTRSTNKSFKKLIAEELATPETIYETMCNQTVDLVFTAHPTQVGCLPPSQNPCRLECGPASMLVVLPWSTPYRVLLRATDHSCHPVISELLLGSLVANCAACVQELPDG